LPRRRTVLGITYPPEGIGGRSIVVPLFTAIVVAFAIRELVPVPHKGGSGLIGVAALIVGVAIVTFAALWSLSADRNRAAIRGGSR
jgi:hypothetical protein